MADGALLDLIFHGREGRDLEYKSSMNWAPADIKAKLTRTILAMSNIRDGGAIVVGVEEAGQRFTPIGMSAADLASFTQDEVSEYVNEFADPYVDVK